MTNSFVNTSLFKTLSAIFVFVVLTISLLDLVGSTIFKYSLDPLIRDILLTGVGYILNQLGSYQGAATATQSTQATIHAVGVSSFANTVAMQANTVAMQENTKIIENGGVTNG